jgi:hypothetical protein
MPRGKKNQVQKVPGVEQVPTPFNFRGATGNPPTQGQPLDKMLEAWPKGKRLVVTIDDEELLCEVWMIRKIIEEGLLSAEAVKKIIVPPGEMMVDVEEDALTGKVLWWHDSVESSSPAKGDRSTGK